MRRFKYKREKLKFIDDLVRISKCDEYGEHVKNDSRLKEHVESHRALKYWNIKFFDVLNNEDINHLLRSISKLNKSNYKIDLHYRVSHYKFLDYFEIQYDRASTGLLAKVEFLADDYIKNIEMSLSQVNNNEAIVTFEVNYSHIISFTEFIDLIEKNKEVFKDSKFTTYYYLDSHNKSINFDQITSMTRSTFIQVTQAKIGKILKLGLGKKYRLPYFSVVNCPANELSKDEMKDIFLGTMIDINDNGQYIVYDYTTEYGLEMNLYFSGNTYNPVYFGRLLYALRMDFYFYLFEKIEYIEMNRRINKYFSKSRKRIKANDYKWLVNKVRSIRDNRIHQDRDLSDMNELSEWKQYRNGSEVELELLSGKYTEKYEKIYNECLEHIKTLYGLQKENLIINIASWTLVATLIGILITISLSIYVA